MSPVEKQSVAQDLPEQHPEGEPRRDAEEVEPRGGRTSQGKKEADFTPKTVFGDVAL